MKSSQIADMVEEFAHAELGDERLHDRLETIVRRVSAKPEVSFPRAMQTDADLEGFYRFLRNESVSLEALLQPHVRSTLDRVADHHEILAVHDTTEFRYGGDRGLGQIQRTGKGFLGHFSLVVTADEQRDPLGVLGVEAWTRLGPSPSALLKQKKIDYKQFRGMPREHDRWWRAIVDAEEAIGHTASVIHVADAEADDYSLMENLVESRKRWVIRLGHDRLLEGDSGEKIRTFIAKRSVVCTRNVALSRRKGGKRGRSNTRRREARKEREATMAITAAPVSLRRPPYMSQKSPLTPSLQVHLVSVREVDPPADQQGVEWLLFTTEPIETTEQILKIVDCYRARWVIEEFFKALKTGCAFEKRQLDSFQTLRAALGLLTPIAWSLLRLRSLSRTHQDAPAQTVVTALQLEVLRRAMLRPHYRPLPEVPTAPDIALAIAALGGHIRNNGDPGWQVLGRGFQDLLMMVAGYRLATESARSDQS